MTPLLRFSHQKHNMCLVGTLFVVRVTTSFFIGTSQAVVIGDLFVVVVVVVVLVIACCCGRACGRG